MTSAVLTYEFYNGSTWVDMTADVLASPEPSWKRGTGIQTPDVFISSPGALEFSLNNSASNANTTLGYYSPGHGSAVAGFDVGTKVRLISTYSATDRYQFYGRISFIKPLFGERNERRVDVTVLDFMNEMANQLAPLLTLQTNKTSDQLLTTLVGAMDIAPLNTSYDTGPDTFASSFFDIRGERQTVLSVAQKIVQSDLSRLYVTGNATDGETLVLANRHSDLTKTSQLTLTNAMTGISVERDSGRIYNKFVVNVNRPDIGTSDEVLYSLSYEKELKAGEVWSFSALYRDPDGGARLSGKSMVTPVADTDYKFSSSSGSGNDLNASLGISLDANYSTGGDKAEVTLTNNASVTGYLWLFNLRGRALRLRDPIEVTEENAASITSFGERRFNYSTPYLSNDNTAKSIAEYNLNKWKSVFANVAEVSFVANRNATLMTAAVNLDIGDLITITESVSGLASEVRIITGLEIVVKRGNLWTVNYLTARANTGQIWSLGDAGYSELGDNTYLGF